MKLVTFTTETGGRCPRERFGVLEEGRIIDLSAAHRRYQQDVGSRHRVFQNARSILGADLGALIDRGTLGLKMARDVLDFLRSRPQILDDNGVVFDPSTVKLQVPFQPLSLRDGLSSVTHFKNSLEAIGSEDIPELFYERPFYYRTSHTEIAGHDDPVPWPSFGDHLDFELELACVIGKKGRDLSTEQAREHILGYTIFNDFSIRDYQATDMSTMLGPSKCKNFVRANVLGPCVVTADEFDPVNVSGRVRVNGEQWTDTDNSDMYYSFPELVSFISREESIYPGEVIAAGTFAYGCGLELDRFLAPGDTVELEIDGIGVLRNRIGEEQTSIGL